MTLGSPACDRECPRPEARSILRRMRAGALVWPEGDVPGSPAIRLGPWALSQIFLGSLLPLPLSPLGLPLGWFFWPVKGFGTLEGWGALSMCSCCGFLPEDLLRQPEDWRLRAQKGGGELSLFLLWLSQCLSGTGGLGLTRPACTNPSAMSA